MADARSHFVPEQFETLSAAGALKLFASPFRADAKDGLMNLVN